MNFEIRDDKEHLPDEEDIYGVNDAEERDAFDTLFGITPMKERLRRRKIRLRILALVVIISFALAFALAGFRHILGW